ncbi:MAG: GSCFA domain-containing protein [Bacteroidales bacterium]|nr:GSCFA domain-containing protein [Bacteroidales bacterium]MDD4210159.1 GSCFA domain-containing protein [Bacteroidales bacterium]
MDSINFRTEIHIPESNIKLNHQDKLMLIGSCFVEHISEKLKEHKFNVLINPYGILFNPASIAQCINDLIKNEEIPEEELHYFNEVWFSFKHHSDFSNPDKSQCINYINKKFSESKKFLQQSDFLLITLGSSIAYRLHSTHKIVSNCHKIPAKEFTKIHLSVDESFEMLRNCIENLRLVHPKIKLIFSLSPVRYIKNDFMENSLSKANLRLCINELIKIFPNTFYFPAFEIMMDDLRDYRFYNSDNIHPSSLAIDYIWECFSKCYFNKETQKINDRLEDISKAYHHSVKVLTNNSYKKFKQTYLLKINQLMQEYPFLHLEKEKKYFSIP